MLFVLGPSCLIFIPRCVIQEVSTQPATSDATGQILSGSLKICGQLRHARVYNTRGRRPKISDDRGFFDLNMTDAVGNAFPHQWTTIRADFDLFEKRNDDLGEIDVHCLRIASHSIYDTFLVLKSLETGATREMAFERVALGYQPLDAVTAPDALGSRTLPPLSRIERNGPITSDADLVPFRSDSSDGMGRESKSWFYGLAKTVVTII